MLRGALILKGWFYMTKFRVDTFLFSFLLFFLMTFALPGPGSAAPVTLRMVCHHGPTDVQTKLLEGWIKEVEARSDGKIKIDFYSGQGLVKGAQTHGAIVSGMVDIGFSALQYTRGRFPLMDFINLPLGFPNGKVATAIINEVNDRFQPEEFKNVKVLYLQAHGPGRLHTSRKPVRNLEDLKGLKIRIVGPVADMVKYLGAVPTSLPMPEVYHALERGVMDGGLWDLSADVDWRLAEEIKYVIECDEIVYSTGFFMFMNKETWDSLEPEQQALIDELSPRWAAKHGTAWDSAAQRGIDFHKELGNEFIQIDAEEGRRWGAAVEPVISDYIKRTEAKGLPGAEVVAFVRQRLKDAKEGRFESRYMD